MSKEAPRRALFRLAISLGLAAVLVVMAPPAARGQDSGGLRFEISFPASVSKEAQTGHIILIVSRDTSAEPRFQYHVYRPDVQPGFGLDVEGLEPGRTAVIDGTTFGWPVESVDDLPAGDYRVQAVLNRYEEYHRADGHTVWLPPNRGEGQHWYRKPGNFYDDPVSVHLDPSSGRTVKLSLDRKIPPIPEPKDTKWVKYVRIKSDLLTEFWGRPMYLGAYVLLPAGFDDHPDARYPLAVHQGHFPSGFGEFSPQPPSADQTGYDSVRTAYAHDLFEKWTGPDFPRMLVVKIRHANQYYDDSYAVNSENLGPWGDAIVKELIPYIEKKFRGIGKGWARTLFGGSTGGWETLADQVFYPEAFNGAWSFCPDPVDFRQYETIDVYGDTSAFYFNADWKKTPQPSGRDYLGHLLTTVRDDNHWEYVQGRKDRSGEQWDIWESVYSPVGEDGYPKRLYDKRTGHIDPEVAEFWKENYDLRYIMERDWATLGPKLVGKIHVYSGTMDSWHLNNAVYLLEDFLDGTTDPYYAGSIEYGDRYEHCWTGDSQHSLRIGNLTVYQRFLPVMARHIVETAPAGADTTSWRY
ncbi:MAG TPA: alpha/beta hydrolase-fold protein [Gemmatimonadota bacterium]|nr:alpha/beta hydrolase-fold protein [Gemmatimonadota bacterium]